MANVGPISIGVDAAIGWQLYSGWVGPTYPNLTSSQPLPSPPHHPILIGTWPHDCGRAGCLYDVADDEGEHHELSASLPSVAERMRTRLDALNAGNYDPDRGKGDPAACRAAESFGGFYGPFVS